MARRKLTSSAFEGGIFLETTLPPPTPGEELRGLLERTQVTQEKLARALGVSRLSVNQIVNDRRAITAEMALLLAKAFSTSVDFWVNLQLGVDLYKANRKIGKRLAGVRVLRPASSNDELYFDLPPSRRRG